MKRYIIRSVKYTTIIVSSLLILLIATTLVINFLFKDQVIKYVLEQLGQQVDAKIFIKRYDFTLWRQFPNASVMFNGVHAQSSNRFKSLNDATNKNDTLLIADKIFLEFNLIELLKGNYQLKRLNIKDGYLKLLIDQEGNSNYDIIIKKSGKQTGKEFELELNDLLFTNTVLDYNNIKSSIKFKGTAQRLSIKGNFKAKTYNLKVQSSFFANNITVSGNDYIINKPLELDFNLLVDNKYYQIKNAKFKIVKLQLLAQGDFDLGEAPKINLQITGRRLNLSRVIDVLPDRFRTPLTGYSCNGVTELTILIKGPIAKHTNPKVDLKLSLKKATIAQNSTGIKLHNINLEGTYSNGFSKDIQSSVIKINKFMSNLGSGEITGTCLVENLSQPLVNITFNSKLNLRELKTFFKLDTLDILDGSVEGTITASAKLDKLSGLRTTDIKNLKCGGHIKLTDAGVRMKKSDYYFEQINGTITLNNNIYFNNISLVVHGNDFRINGSLTDGLQYFLKQRKDVTLLAEVTSHNLDLSKYFIKNTAKSKREYSRELLFPEDVNLDVKLNVSNFKLNKFNAKWITGYLSYKPTMFVLKSISLETFTGHVSGNGVVLQDMYNNFIIKGQVDASRIDIQQMFYTFNNFSQVVVEDRHLRGRLSGKINFSTEWNNALAVNPDKVLIDADFTITNGQLVNYEPLRGLSDYISLEELQDIKFSTLKNQIYVKDKQVIIPQMDIASSAFNISASGTHYFSNHYNYKVKVLLSELLWGKAKKAKRENEEFGIVEDDGLGKTSIYLSIEGYKKDYKISYDSKKTLIIVKEGLDKQKSELKSIFSEEFGWFKKDSTLKKNQTQKKDEIKVEWEEENKPQQQEEQSSKKPKNKKQEQKPPEEKIKVEWE